jgi:hypothetical protein
LGEFTFSEELFDEMIIETRDKMMGRKMMRTRLRLAFAFLIATGCAPFHAQSTSGMVPFVMDQRGGFPSTSPVDVSFLLDAPAGKNGFIKVVNGHLATGDGRRIRLWGVNITDWSQGSRQIPSKEDSPFLAGTLARFGVNCVRFQFLDLEAPRGLIDAHAQDSRHFDAAQLDKEDFFIAELEKRGIYIDFNLLVGRPFKAADGVQDANLLRQGAKGTSLFDRRMIELQEEYAKQLLGHLNPYTGLRYAEDPAVAIVEINNENALNIGFRAPSHFYEDELTSMYNKWLAKHRTPAEIADLRNLTGVSGDETPVPLMGGFRNPGATAPPERFYAEAEFYSDVQKDYFAEFESYLKGALGSKSLVIATADHSHSGSGYPILKATAASDVIDGHTYWQHPEMYVGKSPMVNDPFNSTVVELSRSAIEGKPYTVSEVNEPFPNDYDGEGIPILASYGAMQDWDGIFWYTFEPKFDPAWKAYVGDPFDISLDPVKMPELAAGALMFLRADIQKAQTIVKRTYSEKQVFDSMLIPPSDRPYFTPGFPLDLPLEHQVRISSLDGPATLPFPQASQSDTIQSDTGQLAWHRSSNKDGWVTVDSPKSQAMIGFLKSDGVSITNLAANVENAFCTILLTSIGGDPIAKTSRLLLVAGGRVENTGQQWNSAGTDVTNWGGSPTLIEQVKGSVILRHIESARAVHLQPIDGAGKPLGPWIDALKVGDDWKMLLGSPITTWYEITVDRK